MQPGVMEGLFLVLLGGIFQGSFLYPSKFMKGWEWENYWLIFAATAYLLCPWGLALATVPRLDELYRTLPLSAFASAALFGSGWGLGALTFGLGVNAVGLALGFAVIVGVAAVVGMLVPLVLSTVVLNPTQSVLTAAAAVLMVAGVVICSFAGRWREATAEGRKNYTRGLVLCITSGLLSACGNLGFAFGGEVIKRAQLLGTPERYASNALWTLLAFPLFLCNAAYAGHLLYHRRTFTRYQVPASPRMGLLSASMGLMWMAGMMLYGMGATKLGALGSSLGWAILMSSMVLAANALGLVSGEWSAAPQSARSRLWVGIGVLVVAIALLGYANAA